MNLNDFFEMPNSRDTLMAAAQVTLDHVGLESLLSQATPLGSHWFLKEAVRRSAAAVHW